MAQINKFAGQTEQNAAKRAFSGEEKISLDQRLARLEDDIRRLKVEFDVFFNGGTKRAPYDTKNRVESTIKRIGDERSITFAQRYHYNSLVARYNSMRELWRRTLKGREEGRDAAAIVKANRASSGETIEKNSRDSKVFCSEASSEPASIEKLYQALIRAKTECGESVAGLSFADFQQKLMLQTDACKKTRNCENVSFEVATESGRVVFRARVEQ